MKKMNAIAISIAMKARISTLPRSFVIVLVSLTALYSLPAMAQYQWIDNNGRKVYSDQPPPTSVPEAKIIKQPAKSAPSPIPATSAAADVAKDPAAAKTAATTAMNDAKKDKEGVAGKDKELEAKKKQMEEAEAAKVVAKKKAEAEQLAKTKADNCQRAQSAKAGLDSGVRIGTTNVKGERAIMDDAARMVESKRIQGIIQSDCK